MEPLLEVENLKKSYPTGGGDRLEVLRGVSFAVHRGEVVAIVGESGTGKSTLLHLLGALDRPDSGTVHFDGHDIFLKDDDALAAFRNRSVGFIFQFHHLLPEFTALENVAMPGLIQGLDLEAARPRVLELLRQLGLEARADHRPSELSGGEQQRVAVARALMNRPGLILADEPTGNLDSGTGAEIMQILDALHDEGSTILLVTHEAYIAEHASRQIHLLDGRIQPGR